MRATADSPFVASPTVLIDNATLYDFSKDFKENPSLTDLIDSINHLLLSIGAGLAIGIAVTAFCLGLLIIYRTRKLEKDE